MPVVDAAGAKPGAECHAAAGAVALEAGPKAGVPAPAPNPAPTPLLAPPAPLAHTSLSAPRPPAGMPAAPRSSIAPAAAPRAVKGRLAAVRPAFAIVARRMPGLYDLMLLIDPTAPEERRSAAISEAESMINSGGEL